LLKFDPSRHSLVTDEAPGVVQQLRVPVAYAHNPNWKPEGYMSSRVFTLEACNSVPEDTLSRIQKSWFQRVDANGKPQFQNHLCTLSFPQMPDKNIVEIKIKQADIWKHKRRVEEKVYELSAQGKKLGEYREAYIYRYLPFPVPIIGCFLNSGASKWDCDASFMASFQKLDTRPKGATKLEPENPTATLLGLSTYSYDEMRTFKSDPSNDAILIRLPSESQRIDEASFGMLDELLNNPQADVPWRLGYSLSRNRALAVTNEEKMVSLFLTLTGRRKKEFKSAEEKAGAMGAAIAAMPGEALSRHAAAIATQLDSDALLNTSPELYVRLADFTDRLMPAYARHLQPNGLKWGLQFAPALAICRIGKADDATKARMRELLGNTHEADNRHMYQALFVALIAVGERTFVEKDLDTRKPRQDGWYRKVLAQFVASGGRPNNCMTYDWPLTNYVSEEMTGIVR
jgi:hypothetical protein